MLCSNEFNRKELTVDKIPVDTPNFEKLLWSIIFSAINIFEVEIVVVRKTLYVSILR